MRKVYLAGPTVFLPEAPRNAVFETLKSMLLEHDLIGLSPMDNEIPKDIAPSSIANWIRNANIAMLREADAVIADVSPFRGPDMDPGTAWEIGYASALGLPIEIYSKQTGNYIDEVSKTLSPYAVAGIIYDADGMAIENFGLKQNLMIAGEMGQQIHPTSKAAIEHIAERLLERTHALGMREDWMPK